MEEAAIHKITIGYFSQYMKSQAIMSLDVLGSNLHFNVFSVKISPFKDTKKKKILAHVGLSETHKGGLSWQLMYGDEAYWPIELPWATGTCHSGQSGVQAEYDYISLGLP